MSNTNADLVHRAERMSAQLDIIGEAQEEIKLIKAEAKNDGYNLKALGQIVKEMRRGPDYQEDQLTLELEVDTYRRAVGLPVDLEVAQKLAREAAAEDGLEPKTRKGSRDLNDELEGAVRDLMADGTTVEVLHHPHGGRVKFGKKPENLN